MLYIIFLSCEINVFIKRYIKFMFLKIFLVLIFLFNIDLFIFVAFIYDIISLL